MVFHRSLSSFLVSIGSQITSVERHLAGFEKVRLVTGKVDCGATGGGFGVVASELENATCSPLLPCY